MSIIDTTFDFTNDTPNYWKNFWINRDGLGRGSADPDSKSAILQKYHQALWSKPLPNGEIMALEIGRNKNSYYLQWGDFTFTSDLLVNGYRWKRLQFLIRELENKIPNYRKFIEDYLRKTYTIGGMIIFPRRKWGINQSRGCNPKIFDRFDLTLECIRKFYNNEKSPLYAVLEREEKFFSLFVDFKGFTDFFFLQDMVSNGCTSVNIFIGNGDFSENPLPKNADEWLMWHDKTVEFIDNRNKRIAENMPKKAGLRDVDAPIALTFASHFSDKPQNCNVPKGKI